MPATLIMIGTKYACNLVPIVIKIAGIYGPHPYWDCRYIWSPIKLLLQANLVPTMTDIAGIIGPRDKYDFSRETFKIMHLLKLSHLSNHSSVFDTSCLFFLSLPELINVTKINSEGFVATSNDGSRDPAVSVWFKLSVKPRINLFLWSLFWFWFNENSNCTE